MAMQIDRDCAYAIHFLPCAIMILDTEQERLTCVNRAATRLLTDESEARENASIETVVQRIHPEDRRRAAAFLRGSAASLPPSNSASWRWRDVNEEWIRMAAVSTPWTENGSVRALALSLEGGMLCMGLACQSIRRLWGCDYQALFDATTDAMAVYDFENDQWIDVNPAWCEMYGYSREEGVRMNVGDVSANAPPYTVEEAARFMAKAVAGEPQSFEWRGRHRCGRLLWQEVSLQRVTLNGRDRLLAVTRDTTKRREAQEAAEIHQAEAAHPNRLSLLAELAAGIAHEVNQPLTSIAMLCDAAIEQTRRGKPTPESLLETLGRIAVESQRAGKIIHRMRKLAQKRSFQKSAISFEATLQGALELVEPKLRRQGVDVRTEVVGDPLSFHGDAVQMEQLMA